MPVLVFLSIACCSKLVMSEEQEAIISNKMSEHIREFVNRLGSQLGTYQQRHPTNIIHQIKKVSPPHMIKLSSVLQQKQQYALPTKTETILLSDLQNKSLSQKPCNYELTQHQPSVYKSIDTPSRTKQEFTFQHQSPVPSKTISSFPLK